MSVDLPATPALVAASGQQDRRDLTDVLASLGSEVQLDPSDPQDSRVITLSFFSFFFL